MPDRLLIAEDELLIFMDLAARARELGWIVIGPIASASDGLAALDTHAPHAAILDVNLKDGLVTPLALELQSRRIPFVFATANSLSNLPAALSEVVNIGKPSTSHRFKVALERLAGEIVER